jgi:DNA-binding FadR family transcriptional regulator
MNNKHYHRKLYQYIVEELGQRIIQGRYRSDDDQYVYEKYLEIDIAFHTSILKACHNDLLSQIGSTMREAVHQARVNDADDIEIQRESLPFHAAIVDAVARKDPEAAYSASQKMFDDVWRSIIHG